MTARTLVITRALVLLTTMMALLSAVIALPVSTVSHLEPEHVTPSRMSSSHVPILFGRTSAERSSAISTGSRVEGRSGAAAKLLATPSNLSSAPHKFTLLRRQVTYSQDEYTSSVHPAMIIIPVAIFIAVVIGVIVLRYSVKLRSCFARPVVTRAKATEIVYTEPYPMASAHLVDSLPRGGAHDGPVEHQEIIIVPVEHGRVPPTLPRQQSFLSLATVYVGSPPEYDGDTHNLLR
ncbi:hypothetical protein HDU85_003222 [Gaertneriomyces sp. JEL0708]|nr:hypothetical protein HDU85_003222 [Gaertneriomyces sp. JEL0708]